MGSRNFNLSNLAIINQIKVKGTVNKNMKIELKI